MRTLALGVGVKEGVRGYPAPYTVVAYESRVGPCGLAYTPITNFSRSSTFSISSAGLLRPFMSLFNSSRRYSISSFVFSSRYDPPELPGLHLLREILLGNAHFSPLHDCLMALALAISSLGVFSVFFTNPWVKIRSYAVLS